MLRAGDFWQTEGKLLVLFVLGLAVMFGPSTYSIASATFSITDEGHGPILVLMALWAFWYERHVFKLRPTAGSTRENFWGLALIGVAFLVYLLGRLLGIQLFEFGALPLLLAGIILACCGMNALKLSVFPLAFLCFALPLPNHLVDAMTGSLKQVVSQIAEWVLYKFGYPVARSGVVLNVGQYQLLVADACSGLRSILSLIGVGLFYMYLSRPLTRVRTIVCLLALVPVAFVANILRVMILILVTYHFGDAAGQGFVHDFAGLFLFVVAVLMIAMIDSLAVYFAATPRKSS